MSLKTPPTDDGPVLAAVSRLLGGDRDTVSADQVLAELGWGADRRMALMRSMKLLIDSRCLTGKVLTGDATLQDVTATGVTEKGLQRLLPAPTSYDSILLEPEQKDVLGQVIEAVRSVPPTRRQPVLVVQHETGTEVLHPGLPKGSRVYPGDLYALGRVGLLDVRKDSPYLSQVDVTPEGFAYYTELKRRSGEPVDRQSIPVKSYLDGASFKSRHPISYEKWAEAEQMLWSTDSRTELTTIGHKCREAMRAFATELVDKYQPSGADPDRAKTKNRLQAVISQQKRRLGETVSTLLDALTVHWDALNGLVQRQEHGEGLTWEDGRRVVFQTAVVMFEIDRSLK